MMGLVHVSKQIAPESRRQNLFQFYNNNNNNNNNMWIYKAHNVSKQAESDTGTVDFDKSFNIKLNSCLLCVQKTGRS